MSFVAQRTFATFALLGLSFLSIGAFVASARPHIPLAGRHAAILHGMNVTFPAENRAANFDKRESGVRWTNYAPGLGACGATNGPNDFIVALNAPEFDSGSQCFKTITMSYNGKTTQATITDRCAGCASGQLDLTPGLFSFFADINLGEIFGDWEYGSGAPTTTSKPPPPPTSTETPTSSSTPPPSTTSTSTTSSAMSTSTTSSTTASSSTSATSSSSSSAAEASNTPDASDANMPGSGSAAGSNVDKLNVFVLQMGSIIVTGAQSTPGSLADNSSS